MYYVTLKSEEFSIGTTYCFEEFTDAIDFVERSIANCVPADNGQYPIATIRFVK